MPRRKLCSIQQRVRNWLAPVLLWTVFCQVSTLTSGEESRNWQIEAVMPDHPAEAESYLCMRVDLPSEGSIKLVGVEPLSSQELVHHMLLFGEICKPLPRAAAFFCAVSRQASRSHMQTQNSALGATQCVNVPCMVSKLTTVRIRGCSDLEHRTTTGGCRLRGADRPGWCVVMPRPRRLSWGRKTADFVRMGEGCTTHAPPRWRGLQSRQWHQN